MKSAICSPNLEIWPFVRFWLIKRPLRPLAVQDPSALHRSETCFGKPVRPPPSAKTTEASAREAVAEALAVTRRKFFREARRASPQRQNDRARASDGAGLPRLSRKLRPSPGKLFRDGQAPSAKITEASASDAPLPGCRGSFNRRRENFLGKLDGPDPSVKTTGSPTGQTQAQTFDDSSRRKKWYATRPGRVSANPKP